MSITAKAVRYKCDKCGPIIPCYSTIIAAIRTHPMGCLLSKITNPEWKEVSEEIKKEKPKQVEKEASSKAGWFCTNCPQGPCTVPYPFKTKELLELDSKIKYCSSHCVVFPGRQAAWFWEDPLPLLNISLKKQQEEKQQKYLPEDLEKSILRGISLYGKWVQDRTDKLPYLIKKGVVRKIIIIEDGKVYLEIIPKEKRGSYYIIAIEDAEELPRNSV